MSKINATTIGSLLETIQKLQKQFGSEMPISFSLAVNDTNKSYYHDALDIEKYTTNDNSIEFVLKEININQNFLD
jgi:hypothetical protein